MNAIDTNILVYAFDLDEAEKGPKAIAFLESLPVGETVLLWQVACELGAVLTRVGTRSRNVQDRKLALESVRARLPLVVPGQGVLDTAWRLHETQQLSYWDALLLAACVDAGVTRLYTEDLQGRSIVEGVAIVNPFTS